MSNANVPKIGKLRLPGMCSGDVEKVIPIELISSTVYVYMNISQTFAANYNCAPLVAYLFLFCYERDFMKSLSDNQADIMEAFNSTSRYLDDLLYIDNIYFEQMINRMYPDALQLDIVNTSDTEAPFLDLNLCISNGTVSTKVYDKRDDFDFDIVNFPFLDGDVPRRTSDGVYISQLIRLFL